MKGVVGGPDLLWPWSVVRWIRGWGIGRRSVKERSAEKADLMPSCLVPGREALGSATQKLQVFAAVDLTADDVGG